MMRRIVKSGVVPVVTVLVGLVAACAGSPPERADTVPAAESSAPRAPAASKGLAGEVSLSQVQLKAALLTLDDMPTGWTQKKPTPDRNDDVITPARCDRLWRDGIPGRDKPKAIVRSDEFSAGQLGPTLAQSLSSWGSDAAPRVVWVKDALAKCPTFTSTGNGESTKFEVSGLSFPNVGDRTLAVRLSTVYGGFNVTLDMIFVAVGKTAIGLFVTGSLQPMDGGTLAEIARAAVKKVKAA